MNGLMDTPSAADSSSPVSAPDADDLVTRPAQGRVERWLRRLLDLSLRNNLLNCGIGGSKQLRLALADVAQLEDELAKGTAFRLKPAPLDKLTDSQYYGQETAALTAAADAALARRELVTTETEDDLHRRLQMIYSTARREMEESGANTLYVACGFLKWYRAGAEGKAYYAPVLLVPVSLTRTSVKAGFTLRGSDDETRINLTLLEFLRTEFGIAVPELEGELPADESGTDVPRVLELLRQAVAEQKGWEVQSVCILGSFSFTKYLMWRDLADRRESMFRNAIVAQIAAENRTTFPDQGGFPDPSVLDAEVDAAKVFTPLSADSSQLSAVLAAARGKSFVLIGPPGTGKSQTIANMIAHCLGHGKTVLFVAEKAAALQVVHKRLKRIGLQDFCLELHSNKANKKDALAQFRAAAEAVQARRGEERWSENVSELVELRGRLNSLPQTMHRRYADEGTLYGDICRTAQTPPAETPLLQEDAVAMSRDRLKEILDEVRELCRHFQAVQSVPAGARLSLQTAEYGAAWERELADSLARCRSLFAETEQGIQTLAAALGGAESADAAALYPLLKDWTEQPDTAGDAFLPAHAAANLKTAEQLAAHAEQCRALRAQFSLPYPDSAMDAPDLDALLRECRELSVSFFLTRWWGMRRITRTLRGMALSTAKPDCLRDLTALVNLREERRALAAVDDAALPAAFRKGEALAAEDVQLARRHAELAAALSPAALRMAETAAAAPPAPQSAVGQAVAELANLCRKLQAEEPQLTRLLGSPVNGLAERLQGQGAAWAESLSGARALWHEICLWNRAAAASALKGCGKVAELLAAGTLLPENAENAVRAYLAEQRLRHESEHHAVLKDFAPQVHESRMAEFGEKDSALMRKTSEHIRALLTERAAKIAEFGQETSLLQRELSKQRAHMPLRRLLTSLPNITPLLKPCLLMSPLSVAQYLTTETAPFDVVIFDEASQIPVWDAIGVIARGKNAVIVGDPRQMPPTSFFSRSKSAEEEEDGAAEADMESILDECRACGIPEMNLAWHYRSKSESLIAFSNIKYYEDKLVTFPAPVMQDKALTYHHTGGVYESGANKRVNREEARQLVAHVVAALKEPGFRYTEATSIGIVTFNSQQQNLIEDMLEAERAKDDSLEPYFAEDNPEAVFVKNLENVQGDERGIIYFSTTYARDAEGKMSMNFGPLNLSGGERRLNVAVTRARYGMHVFTSMAPEDINLSRTNARGAADLHDFLDYARRGAAAYLSTHAGAAEREQLAAAVALQLQARGWNCRTAVGVSGYRIDLAVEHPDREGETLAGIMLDGAAYAASNTARDRDVLRPSVLTGLGWRLIHLWAIDWWRHPEAVAERLDRSLHDFLEMGPPTPPQLPELVGAAPEAEEESPAAAPQRVVPAAPLVAEEYREFTPAKPLPAFADIKDAALSRLLCEAVQTEGPVTESRLTDRLSALCPGGIRRQQGAARIGELITHLIVKGELENTPEPLADGSFRRVLTRPGQPAVSVRTKGTRDWIDIPRAEWQAAAEAVREHLGCLAGCDDHIKGTATCFGIPRLTKPIREHITALLAQNNG